MLGAFNMFNSILAITLTFFCLHAFAKDRKTLTSDNPKYSVSQSEASQILATLKKETQGHTYKRPSANAPTEKASDETSFVSRSCWADEDQFQQIQQSVLNPWMRAWQNQDVRGFNALLAKKNSVDKFAVSFEVTPETMGNINVFPNWNSLKGNTDVQSYLTQFKKIDDLNLVTFKYVSPSTQRDKSLNMEKVELQIQYDLRAIANDGARRNDRGPMKVVVVKQNGTWKIEEIKNWGLETLTTTKPSFEDYTQASGVQAVPEYQRLEAIRRGGYALALGDINNDGFQDMYLGAFGPGTLLLGNSKGQFETAKSTGLGQDTLVKSAVMADFNNDGLVDLLLTRFVPTLETKPSASHHTDILVYQNLGKGKFKKAESIFSSRTPADTAMPAAVGDFNNDGKLDFYVGFPGSRDFTVFGQIPERENVRAQGVYMNLGNFKFSENNLEDINTLIANKTEYSRIFPHSSVALDFDQDGDTDIMVIDDRGHLSPAYQNMGDGKFAQAQEKMGLMNAGFGMGMSAADIDNNGILDIALTNVNFTIKHRIDASCQANWKQQIFNEQDHGLKFFYGMKKGQFADATMKNGLFYAGEGLAGLEFIDYNNDGHQDLYVSNGLWTGTDKEQDLSLLFAKSSFANEKEVILESRTDTQSQLMKVLAGFAGDIFGKKKSKARPQLAGFQRNRLFLNKGDGSFIEVGYLENVDSTADGYVIAKADIDNNGSLDLVLRNGDPGTAAVNFPAVQVFKNNSQGNSVRLKLLGQNTNSDAIGSSVTVQADGVTQYQQLLANNGAAQSEMILHFGIGYNKVADKIVITWPSKKTTTLINVKPGLHVIKENSGALAQAQ